MGKSIRSKSKRKFRTLKRTTFLREQDKIIRITRKVREKSLAATTGTTIGLLGALGSRATGQAVVATDSDGTVRARAKVGAMGDDAAWRSAVLAHEKAAAEAGSGSSVPLHPDDAAAMQSTKRKLVRSKLALAAVRSAHQADESDDVVEEDDQERGFSFQKLAREVQSKRGPRQGHLGGSASAPHAAGEAAFAAIREGRGHRGKKGDKAARGKGKGKRKAGAADMEE